MRSEMARWIDDRSADEPQRIALRFEEHDITWRELCARTVHLAAALRDAGAVAGDRIAYLGANHPEIIALAFACARTATVFVPLNWRLAPRELCAVVASCRPVLLLCDPEYAATGAELAASCNARLAVMAPRDGPWFHWDWPRLDQPRNDAPQPHLAEPPVMLLYTSGTTGQPKGAAHPQGAVALHVANAIEGYGLTRDDNVLVNLPLFHVGGLVMLALPALKAGALVTLQRRFDAGQALRATEQERITLWLAVATTLKAVLEHPAWRRTDLSSLRLVMTGASIIPRGLLQPFFDRGIVASQVFGATEMGIGACLPAADALRKLGSVGRAALHRTMRLQSRDGTPVPAGEVGEILVGGPGLMSGYWDNPEATAACLRDGWFNTGDLGTCDAEGYYTIVSRQKEMIISGGENVYPAEIENVLACCPDIVEAAVVGRPDEKWGEVPVAFVVRKPGSTVAAADLQAALRSSLARYKQPKDVVFCESLPRNAMGKVLRAELRRRATGGDQPLAHHLQETS